MASTFETRRGRPHVACIRDYSRGLLVLHYNRVLSVRCTLFETTLLSVHLDENELVAKKNW